MTSPEHRPNINRMAALGGLLASSTAYALALSTRTGKRWADEQTWATVVAGTSLTLAWLAVEDHRAAQRSWLYFAVAGAPMVLRSLWHQLERMDRIIEREMG